VSEVEQPIAVPLADSVREEVAEDTRPMVWTWEMRSMGMQRTQWAQRREEPLVEGSQLE